MSVQKFKFILIAAFLFMHLPFLSEAQPLCAVSKNSNLAIDQRDDQRLKCLKSKKSTIKVAQCLEAAKTMEYSTNAEEARLLCLYDLRQQPSKKECLQIVKNMEYPDSGDEVRWECLRRFSNSLKPAECRQLASGMAYPANGDRAKQFCEQ
ncbi:hypothetical protein [Bdellovibrio reynosensis]|uniref:hypothetical protein n=1 Tax=Bdellovibrio reynosensis TaxID=2835041 RepID=UPI0038B31268